ncbi:acyltransferase family protein [Blastococcus sp. SYSU DS0552]
MTSTVEAPATLSGEIRPLTGLRIVAAAWVVVFHFMFTPGDAYTRFWEPLRPVVQTGALGVDLFYVLSGFVITLTYLDKLGRRPSARGAILFWWARICRIWPVYALVTTLFGGWIIYKSTRVTDGFLVWQGVQPEVSVSSWLTQLAMVQLWDQPHFAGASWVGPAWSISAEWLAYVAFPLVVLVLWRLRRLPAWIAGLLAIGCMVPMAYVCYRTGNPYYDWSWAARIGAGFLSGALTCLAVRKIRITPRAEGIAAVVAALALVEILVGLWWGFWRGQGEAEYGGVVVLAFPVLVGSLALSRRGLSRALSTDAMVHGGRISFSLYLVHVPVFEIFWTAMGWESALAPGSAIGTFLIPHVLVGTLLLAHLMYRFVEEPSRLWLRGRGPARWLGTRQGITSPGGTSPAAPATPPPGEQPLLPRAGATVDGGAGQYALTRSGVADDMADPVPPLAPMPLPVPRSDAPETADRVRHAAQH